MLQTGSDLERAGKAVIAIHGRGGSAGDIIGLARTIGTARETWLAPQAADHTWYPYSFLAPVEQNQPYLDSALSVIEVLMQQLEDSGVPANRVVLLGFSQGACLASEFVARHPRRYGGLIVYSGGLIGAQLDPSTYASGLAGTPVFGGCSDVDAHIPVERFETTGEILAAQGAVVDFRVYPGMAHTINKDELAAARTLLQGE